MGDYARSLVELSTISNITHRWPCSAAVKDRNICSIIQHKIYFSMCGLSCWNTSRVHDYHVLMTPCSLVVPTFRTCSFRLQVRKFLLRKWRQQVPPKHRRPYAKQHGGILQKTEIFIVVTVGTTDPVSENKFSAKGKVQKIWLGHVFRVVFGETRGEADTVWCLTQYFWRAPEMTQKRRPTWRERCNKRSTPLLI